MSKKKTIKQKQKVNVNVSTNVIINKTKRARRTTVSAPKPVQQQQQQPFYIPIQSPQFDYSQIQRLVSSEFNKLYEPLQSLKDYYNESLKIKTIDIEPIPTPEKPQEAIQENIPDINDIPQYYREPPEPAPEETPAKKKIKRTAEQIEQIKLLQQKAEAEAQAEAQAEAEVKRKQKPSEQGKSIIYPKRGRPKGSKNKN